MNEIYGCGYSAEPHGETFWEEWYECPYCHWRWSIYRHDDRCDCMDLAEMESKEGVGE